MGFYDRFSKLCKERGVAPSAVAEAIGLNRANASFWKQGSVPSTANLEKLADYFGVSVGNLLGREKETVVIPNRLKVVAVDDPSSPYTRYELEAADPEALAFGMQIFSDAGIPIEELTPIARIYAALDKLNYTGQQTAVERVEELSEIPRYRRDAGRAAEGTDDRPKED